MSKTAQADNILELKGITKKFGALVANNNINLDIRRGEVHALLGENGAGKSTLMSMIYGLHKPTSGEIFINGKNAEINSPKDAIEKGIGMVFQHMMLVDVLTIEQNIIIGNEYKKAGIFLDMKKTRQEVEKYSKQYGLHVDPGKLVSECTVSMQQKAEIIKVLLRGAEILIFDEPTAVLTPQEIDEFCDIVKNLTKAGKTVIIITHKIKEIMAMADRCTVIRKGEKIDTFDIKTCTEDDLVKCMIGRELSSTVQKAPGSQDTTPILTIKNLTAYENKIKCIDGLNLEVRRGEILGIAGVDGNGQREFVECISGLLKCESGSVDLDGQEIFNKSPKNIIKSGLSGIKEDRLKHGIVKEFNMIENSALEKIDEFSSKGIIDYKAIQTFVKNLIQRFDINPKNEKILCGNMSGGNQQKLIIARELANDPKVLIASQPTRGLDVGAIEFVHKALIEHRNNGNSILLISYELDEIMKLADRIAVMFDGKIVDIIDAKDADERVIGSLMARGAE